jgi:hypothetical protein
MRWIFIGLAFFVVSFGAIESRVNAASSFSDPLTSFDAGSYTVSGTDPIVYDASGAHFGTGAPGDDGRTYQRTNARNFAQVQSFTAEITFEITNADQEVFIGLGAGDKALFGTPDWSTQLSSASFWPEFENDKFVRFRTANDINVFADSIVAGFEAGVHRFRMTYNKSVSQLLGEIDVNYAGGPFVADVVSSNFPIVTTSLNGPDGWVKGLLSEPARIFFGGDDGATFRDLSVTVVPEPATGLIVLMGMTIVSFRRTFRFVR